MSVEHRSPTPSTAQYLYAHAFRCAFHECTRPLYRVDDNTGARTLNSRICHINARREGGPRFDRNQSERQNRGEANLVLMCLEHASAIDDPLNVAVYTADKLREWKAKQFMEYERLRQGWRLDASMAEEVLRASEKSSAITITDSDIRLAGEGGRAPGAGGGGGGAIGAKARGGDGGNGGGIREERGEYQLPLSMVPANRLGPEHQDTQIRDMPYGAGGGGGSAMGENARGGDGGGGGETVRALVDMEALRADGYDHCTAAVGDGGQPGKLFGQRATRGRDSVLDFVAKDGQILKSIRAKGNDGAFPGESKLPAGVAEITQDDILAGFRITTLLPVTFAEIREGLFFVLGGGWRSFKPHTWPVDMTWTVAVSAQWPSHTLKSAKGLFVSIFKPDGYETSRVAIHIAEIHSVEPGACKWLVPIGCTLDVEGEWKVRAHADKLLLNEIAVSVSPPSPQT